MVNHSFHYICNIVVFTCKTKLKYDSDFEIITGYDYWVIICEL